MLPFICKRIPSKERESSTTTTIAELVIGAPRIDHVNQSYSDIDYFPMKSGNRVKTVSDAKLSSSHDLSSDCYCNVSENFQAKNNGEYMQTTLIQSDIIDIPKAIIQHNSGIINPKRS